MPVTELRPISFTVETCTGRRLVSHGSRVLCESPRARRLHSRCRRCRRSAGPQDGGPSDERVVVTLRQQHDGRSGSPRTFTCVPSCAVERQERSRFSMRSRTTTHRAECPRPTLWCWGRTLQPSSPTTDDPTSNISSNKRAVTRCHSASPTNTCRGRTGRSAHRTPRGGWLSVRLIILRSEVRSLPSPLS